MNYGILLDEGETRNEVQNFSVAESIRHPGILGLSRLGHLCLQIVFNLELGLFGHSV